MSLTFMSPQSKAKREADLERMRAKWRKDRVFIRRKGEPRELLQLSMLAHACRVAATCVQNPALKAHLELAATYFDEAEG